MLQKTQQDNVQQQLFVNGKLEAVYGRGTDPDNQTKPGDNGKAASPNYITLSNFDPAYRPVTNNYPSAGVGQYAVQAGDTLQGIAQNAYGDSGLWYLIAQANGLASDAELRVAVGERMNKLLDYAPK
ncbi:LysM peptidoglycan-binding domain-containing protein [Noviherbaspirillum pedocola]|uniref:LysM peptidoglycan-binding domain-containing protein n=1 Tax=Noviherbaspirillum pedocola TaxID=2801341 RepID=A0A934SWC3_9BURK|nr:LysM domain-containing protein [Noviherbaspirillum pedocola]MBK4738031.1 LysM peptidoglycan-binding domain-containing protein [Noviherbaspirillum pedocola]